MRRGRIFRLESPAAYASAARGALIIDIRSVADRGRDRKVPSSLHIPRAVLEWRLDSDSAWRNPSVGGLDRQVVLLCAHGYSSILAPATLEISASRTSVTSSAASPPGAKPDFRRCNRAHTVSTRANRPGCDHPIRRNGWRPKPPGVMPRGASARTGANRRAWRPEPLCAGAALDD
jgi:rhodanese-related sulfurtransferase